MDMTMTPQQAHNWEVFGQLALCSQEQTHNLDTQRLMQCVVNILQRYLTASWGMLVLEKHGDIHVQASWGVQRETTEEQYQDGAERSVNSSHDISRIALHTSTRQIGYLLLADQKDAPENTQVFYEALGAQISLLLATQLVPDSSATDMPVSVTSGNHTELNPAQEVALLQRISALSASTAAISPQDHTLFYQHALDAMVQIVAATHGYLYIFDRKKGFASRLVVSGETTDIENIPFSLNDNPAVTWLDTYQRAIVSRDAQHDEVMTRFHDLLQSRSITSVVMVPLLVGSEVLGCARLDFVRHTPPITEHSIDLCQTIAYQIARVVENTRLSTQADANAQALEHKVGELSTLLEAARLLGASLQSNEVLNNLMDLVSRQLGVTTVALWTISNDNVLRPTAMYGIPLDMAREMRVPVGQGLTGKVAETGVPLKVLDVNEERRSLYPSFNEENRLTSFMGVPIFYHERIIGVLSVMTNQPHDFSTDEMLLLMGLAGQAAIALENARLFQERERRINELTMINKISSTVNSTLDLDEMLFVLHWGISEVLDTSFSSIALYDTGKTGQSPTLREHVVRENSAVQRSTRPLPLDGSGLIDHLILENKPMLFQTNEEITNFLSTWQKIRTDQLRSPINAPSPEINSWLGVPIMLGGNILGVIYMQSTRTYAYTEDDMQFLSTVVSQVAVAVSNARLFSERERRLREITVLKDIGNAISSTLDMEGALKRLYREMGQAIDMNNSLIALYNERTNILSYPLCYEDGERIYLEPTALVEGSNEWAIRNRQPLLLHTIEQSEQMGLHDFGQWTSDVRSGQSGIRHPRSRRVESAIVVPIISNIAVLGVINIRSYEAYAFDEDDLRFAIAVANQLAITISNITMFLERERRISELATFNDIGQALSSTVSIDELPHLIYAQTSRLLDTTNFCMALFDEETGDMTFSVLYDQGVSYNVDMSINAAAETIMPPEHFIHPGLYRLIVYLIQRVISKRETLLLKGSDLDHINIGSIEELREEMRYMPSTTPRPCAWLGVPMIVAEKVIGVIGIQSYDNKYAYGSYEAHLLSTIATWSAIALQNARLFEEIKNLAANLEQRVAKRTLELEQANVQLRQEKEYVETIHSITLELTASLDLDKIINRALEVTSRKMGVARGSIMLRELQSGSLVCRAVLQEQGIVESAEVPIAFERGEGLAGWVMEKHQPVCIPDVLVDSRWVVESGRADEVRSVAAAPLMTGDSTLGVLILSSPTVDYFSESHVRLLATIANEVAIAIYNAQLYTYINEMATRLADLLEQQKEETTRNLAILQSLTEGVIVFDEDRTIQLMNPAAEHMLNIPAGDMVGHSLDVLETYGEDEEHQQRAATLHKHLQTGLQKVGDQETIYTIPIELPSPTQTIHTNVANVTEPGGQYYGNVAVLRDITREIEADRTKREFISNVSHELRTPLTSIKGYIDVLLLKSMGDLNDSQVNFLNIVKTNTNRLMDLINDILVISRIESGKIKLKFTEVAVAEVIGDVYQSLQLEAEKKDLDVTLYITDDLPMIMADEQRLTQIIFNLFSNAVKYTFEGGDITIRAALNPGGMLQVEVEDTGVGMTPDQVSKLFRPFYRADNPLREVAGGTGLGLSITKSLVEQHGGELWVTSEQGKGSVFSLVLPLEQQTYYDDEPDEDNE